jgi:hypothetical protein
MPCSKVFTTLWYVLFDRHVRISKPNEPDLITFLRSDSKLFAAAGVATGLVVSLENLASNPYGHVGLTSFLAV